MNKKGWKRPKKCFDQLSGVCRTWKLVKIHNNRACFIFQKGFCLQNLNLNSCKNIVWSDQNQINIFKTLKQINTLKMGGLTMRGEFNFSDAISHLAKLRILEISDLSIKDEMLATALSHPPLLSRLVMQETMSDQKQLIRIVNFQTCLTHLDLSRYIFRSTSVVYMLTL